MSGRGTRETILELAIAVIDEQGEPGIRTNHLAHEAGTTPPTLYHFFGSREGLIEAAQAERFFRTLIFDTDIFIAELNTSKTKKDILRAIKNLTERRDDKKRDEARRQRMNAIGAAFSRPELEKRIAALHNDMVTRTAEAMRPFQEKGFIRDDIDLVAVVAWYNGAVLGKVLASMQGSVVDMSEWEKIMDEAVLYTLFGSSLTR
jgi:AcrR family transcriptional regulator